MSEQLLCDPCQRLLRGENPILRQGMGDLMFAHHTTAESFQQALALPCDICRFLEAGFCRKLRMFRYLTFNMRD
jgi:hypothetical protein